MQEQRSGAYRKFLLILFGYNPGSAQEFDVPPYVMETVDTVILSLPERFSRYREVIRYRFGLDDGTERSLSEVGRLIYNKQTQTYGITGSRVGQIESKALRILRHRSRSDALREAVSSIKELSDYIHAS